MNQLVRPDWPAPPRVQAFTSTRLQPEISVPESIQLPVLRQVHGMTVVDAASAPAGVEADACYSRDPRIGCRIVTADCLPLLVCNRAGTELAAIHAGWRGLAGGVIEATLSQLVSAPADLLVWLGPAISQPCYEVGVEVREQFLAALEPAMARQVDSCFAAAGERYLADLAGIAKIRLRSAGVRQVYGGEHCTWSEPDLFHSWRRDGAAAGRMTSVIYLEPG